MSTCTEKIKRLVKKKSRCLNRFLEYANYDPTPIKIISLLDRFNNQSIACHYQSISVHVNVPIDLANDTGLLVSFCKDKVSP